MGQLTLADAKYQYNELRDEMEHLEDHIDLMLRTDPEYPHVMRELREVTIKVNKLKRFISAKEGTCEVGE